jgi:hypothetical protein
VSIQEGLRLTWKQRFYSQWREIYTLRGEVDKFDIDSLLDKAILKCFGADKSGLNQVSSAPESDIKQKEDIPSKNNSSNMSGGGRKDRRATISAELVQKRFLANSGANDQLNYSSRG